MFDLKKIKNSRILLNHAYHLRICALLPCEPIFIIRVYINKYIYIHTLLKIKRES